MLFGPVGRSTSVAVQSCGFRVLFGFVLYHILTAFETFLHLGLKKVPLM